MPSSPSRNDEVKLFVAPFANRQKAAGPPAEGEIPTEEVADNLEITIQELVEYPKQYTSKGFFGGWLGAEEIKVLPLFLGH